MTVEGGDALAAPKTGEAWAGRVGRHQKLDLELERTNLS